MSTISFRIGIPFRLRCWTYFSSLRIYLRIDLLHRVSPYQHHHHYSLLSSSIWSNFYISDYIISIDWDDWNQLLRTTFPFVSDTQSLTFINDNLSLFERYQFPTRDVSSIYWSIFNINAILTLFYIVYLNSRNISWTLWNVLWKFRSCGGQMIWSHGVRDGITRCLWNF